MKSKFLSAAIVVALVLLGGLALADPPAYDADSEASSSQDVAGLVALGSSGSSSADPDGTSSEASASALTVAGEDVGPSESCSAASTEGEGNVTDAHSDALLTLGEDTPVNVAVLTAACRARAVHNNDTSSESSTSVLSASAADTAAVRVLGTDSRTVANQGSAHSRSSVTVAEADAGGHSVVVLRCSSSSISNNGTDGDAGSVTFLAVDDTAADNPIGCPVASTDATYERP